MVQLWKKAFRRVTAAEVMAKELANAELELLEARTAQEFAASVISYNESRCKRLRKSLSELEVSK